MPNLMEEVTEYLKKNVNLENCKMLRTLGNDFFNEELKNYSDEFLCTHINKYCRTNQFKNLKIEEVSYFV